MLSEKQISYEIISLRDEFARLNRIVTPLSAITELTLYKKRAINAENMNLALENMKPMSPEERIAELESMHPELVLQNLAEYCNTQEMTNAQIK